jgi:subtilisin-like proprotein convertase family protein
VSLNHTKVFDLRLSLTSPSGTTVLLNSYDPFTGYFEGQHYQQTIFDDEAAVSIADAVPPFEGRYRPLADDGLSAFDGQDACGAWRLRIYDAYYVDTGALEAFGLVITTPEPATALILIVGLGLAGVRRR